MQWETDTQSDSPIPELLYHSTLSKVFILHYFCIITLANPWVMEEWIVGILRLATIFLKQAEFFVKLTTRVEEYRLGTQMVHSKKTTRTSILVRELLGQWFLEIYMIMRILGSTYLLSSYLRFTGNGFIFILWKPNKHSCPDSGYKARSILLGKNIRM
jgi:hypothetical protein